MNRVLEGSNLHHITVHSLRHTYDTTAQGVMSVKLASKLIGRMS